MNYSAPSTLPIYGAAKLHMELTQSIMEIHKSTMGLHKSFMEPHNSYQIMNFYKLDEQMTRRHFKSWSSILINGALLLIFESSLMLLHYSIDGIRLVCCHYSCGSLNVTDIWSLRSFINFIFLFFIKTYLTRMTHQPEAVLHEVLPYTTTQLIYMTTKHQHKT